MLPSGICTSEQRHWDQNTHQVAEGLRLVRRCRLDGCEVEQQHSIVVAGHIAAARAVENRNLDTLLLRC